MQEEMTLHWQLGVQPRNPAATIPMPLPLTAMRDAIAKTMVITDGPGHGTTARHDRTVLIRVVRIQASQPNAQALEILEMPLLQLWPALAFWFQQPGRAGLPAEFKTWFRDPVVSEQSITITLACSAHDENRPRMRHVCLHMTGLL
jgi:hypothetical protein